MDGSIATRYANALYMEAKAQSVEKEVYDYLGVLYTSMKQAPDLQFALANPRVSTETKYKLLTTASGTTTESLFTKFLRLVLEHGREKYLRLMVFVYRDLYREHHNIDRVILETAVPVSQEVVDKVVMKVMARTGRKVECVTRVHPELIGGFRLRIGDIRYDSSFQAKLECIKKRLKG